MRIALVTGSNGLIGSECVRSFCDTFDLVVGIDNDMRSYFFGKDGSTESIKELLLEEYKYAHFSVDIRSMDALSQIFDGYSSDIELIVHAAAQPSHDWASKEPITDFSVNALGTLNLLELYRQKCPNASFIFTSTNKVYGDRPNKVALIELKTRYDSLGYDGIDESMSIDNCKHSIFGASKVAADIMVQEYGKYFGLNTVSFRGGCLTGGNHKGVKLHGFLSYLVKCIKNNTEYEIIGYKGKQVRDNIHSSDLVKAFLCYHNRPTPGAVYNIGGGRENSASIIEAIAITNRLCGKSWNNFKINKEPRVGDHKWYITDFSKFKKDYPEWNIEVSLEEIILDIIKGSE